VRRSAFLVGGGRDPHGVAAALAPFGSAAAGGPVVVLAVPDDAGGPVDEARWRRDLAGAGVREARVVAVDDGAPLTAATVAGAAGVFVAGGWTPRYRRLLVDLADGGWLPADVPYAGFSAGAAIAARTAIAGGWRLADVAVAPPDAAEDLEDLTVAPGLGLLDGAVDVHATQWGTLTRLVHAVRAGLVPSGWAIDEHTGLELRDGEPRAVHGWGSAYRVEAAKRGAVTVTPYAAGRV